MLEKYYIHKETDDQGDHEVHKEGCWFIPKENNREYLGVFEKCQDAIIDAKNKQPYWQIDGCKHCIPECHNH